MTSCKKHALPFGKNRSIVLGLAVILFALSAVDARGASPEDPARAGLKPGTLTTRSANLQASQQGQVPISHPELRTELLRMAREDQAARST